MKARLVIRGFQDVDKDSVVSESPTAHTESLKAMLAVLPTMGFKPKKIDISTCKNVIFVRQSVSNYLSYKIEKTDLTPRALQFLLYFYLLLQALKITYTLPV